MTKPRLAKVRALFYVLQQLTKRGCAYFYTASLVYFGLTTAQNDSNLWTNPNVNDGFKNTFGGGFHAGVSGTVPLVHWGGNYN